MLNFDLRYSSSLNQCLLVIHSKATWREIQIYLLCRASSLSCKPFLLVASTTLGVFSMSYKSSLKSVSMLSNLLESSGSWLRISSDPMKMLSRWDHVLCTSNQMVMTESAVESFFCHPETSSRKWAMYLDVIKFCSWTWINLKIK